MSNAPNAETPEFVMDLVGCARCHGDGHEKLTFKKLTHAFEPDGVKEAYTHWAACPTNGEPILMAFWYLGEHRCDTANRIMHPERYDNDIPWIPSAEELESVRDDLDMALAEDFRKALKRQESDTSEH